MYENIDERNEMVEVEENNEFTPEERTNSNLGFGILIGGALVAATYAGFKAVKKLYSDHKKKKSNGDTNHDSQPEEDVINGDCMEINDEE